MAVPLTIWRMVIRSSGHIRATVSVQTSVAVWADGGQVKEMKQYKGLYRLLNVTMACSLAVSLSLYPVQAEEAATQVQKEAAAKEVETAAQSVPKETQAPVQTEAKATETDVRHGSWQRIGRGRRAGFLCG